MNILNIYLLLGIAIGTIYYVTILLNLIFRWSDNTLLNFGVEDDYYQDKYSDTDILYVIIIGIWTSLILSFIYPIVLSISILYIVIKYLQSNNTNHTN